MNLNKLPRILVDVYLKINENFLLCQEDSHYLLNVLRLKVNDQVVEEKKFALCFAPIKATRMHFIIEKATDLGISHFYPVTTKFSLVDKTSETKFFKWIKAALEQSKGLIIPKIAPLNNLKDFLLEKSP